VTTRHTPDFKPWTSTQFQAFLQCVARDRLGAAFIFIALTGARRDEVAGLAERMDASLGQ
jgi:integrase